MTYKRIATQYWRTLSRGTTQGLRPDRRLPLKAGLVLLNPPNPRYRSFRPVGDFSLVLLSVHIV
jgi:hypothetical protein